MIDKDISLYVIRIYEPFISYAVRLSRIINLFLIDSAITLMAGRSTFDDSVNWNIHTFAIDLYQIVLKGLILTR